MHRFTTGEQKRTVLIGPNRTGQIGTVVCAVPGKKWSLKAKYAWVELMPDAADLDIVKRKVNKAIADSIAVCCIVCVFITYGKRKKKCKNREE